MLSKLPPAPLPPPDVPGPARRLIRKTPSTATTIAASTSPVVETKPSAKLLETEPMSQLDQFQIVA